MRNCSGSGSPVRGPPEAPRDSWGLKALVPRRSRAAESPEGREQEEVEDQHEGQGEDGLQHLAEDVPARPHPGLRTSFPLRSRSLDVLVARARCLIVQAHGPLAASAELGVDPRPEDLGPDATFHATFYTRAAGTFYAGLLGISVRASERNRGQYVGGVCVCSQAQLV